MVGITQHALKGQKLCILSGILKLLPLQGDRLPPKTTQGIALGIKEMSNAPCKGNSFIYCLEF